jgi:hypothetical protein
VLKGVDYPLRGLLAALIAIVLLSFSTAKYSNVPEKNQPKASPEEKTNDLFLGVSAEGWTAIFTGFLTFSTIGLWLVTRTAANAARDAAEALPIVERAYVFLKSAESNDISNTLTFGDDTVGKFSLKWAFKNHGRTPAKIQDLRMMVRYWPKPPSTNDKSGTPLPAPFVIGAGEEWANNPFTFEVYGAEYEQAKAGQGCIYFWGKLGYADIFNARHEVGFCSQWHFGENRFIITEGDHLNYNT